MPVSCQASQSYTKHSTRWLLLQYQVVDNDMFETVEGVDPPLEWHELFMLSQFNTPIEEDT